MIKLTTDEKEELQNIIRFVIDGDYVSSNQQIILERIFSKIELDDSNDQIENIWSVEDIQSIRPDLTVEQSMKVLKESLDNHDATLGVTWDSLKADADQLFPELKTCGNCGNFELYEDENDGYGGCDAKHGTVHQDGNATECQDYL